MSYPARRWKGRIKATIMAAAFLGMSCSCCATASDGVRDGSSGNSGGPMQAGGLSTTSPFQRQYVRRREDGDKDKNPLAISPSAPRPSAATAALDLVLPDGQDIILAPDGGNDKSNLPDLHVLFLQQYGLTKGPGPLSLSTDKKNLYAVTGEALYSFSTTPSSGKIDKIQEMRDGVVDRNGRKVEYFTGLTALTLSPDDQNVYTVGTSVMPGVGGITVLKRNENGELSLVQQYRIDQRADIMDIEGMIGANSVAVSPDGKYTYVSSGGYYRDHNLLVFSRSPHTGNLTLIQNIDVYNTSASRVLPSTLVVAPDGKHVYVVGDNFAISTSVILVYGVEEDGTLTQTQEAGPFRSTLLTSATFDPSGAFLYSTASLGNNLVWIFQRQPDGRLTTVIDPVILPSLTSPSSGQRDEVPAPQGSYSSSLALEHPLLGPLLMVSVEKDNVVHAAVRQTGEGQQGRLIYLRGEIGGEGGKEGRLNRPSSMAWDETAEVLYVSETGDNAISSYKLG